MRPYEREPLVCLRLDRDPLRPLEDDERELREEDAREPPAEPPFELEPLRLEPELERPPDDALLLRPPDDALLLRPPEDAALLREDDEPLPLRPLDDEPLLLRPLDDEPLRPSDVVRLRLREDALRVVDLTLPSSMAPRHSPVSCSWSSIQALKRARSARTARLA
jgi:hypothetical protein